MPIISRVLILILFVLYLPSLPAALPMQSPGSEVGSKKKFAALTKAADGPVVKWTVADLFLSNPKHAVTYHVVGTGYDFLTPLGTALGGLAFVTGYRTYPIKILLGTSGLIGGGIGASFGLLGLFAQARQGASAKPVPWTKEGIQDRADRLSRNYMLRVFDLSIWSGTALAAGYMVVNGGPAKLGLSSAALGILQGLSLGSTAGFLGAMGVVSATQQPKTKE